MNPNEEECDRSDPTDLLFETFFAKSSSGADKSRALEMLKALSFEADKVRWIQTHARFSSLIKACCVDESYSEDVSIIVANCSGDQAKKARREVYRFQSGEKDCVEVVLETVTFQDGGLGCYVYDAEKKMCEWFLETRKEEKKRDSFEGKRVLELGAGVGLLGLFLTYVAFSCAFEETRERERKNYVQRLQNHTPFFYFNVPLTKYTETRKKKADTLATVDDGARLGLR